MRHRISLPVLNSWPTSIWTNISLNFHLPIHSSWTNASQVVNATPIQTVPLRSEWCHATLNELYVWIPRVLIVLNARYKEGDELTWREFQVEENQGRVLWVISRNLMLSLDRWNSQQKSPFWIGFIPSLLFARSLESPVVLPAKLE